MPFLNQIVALVKGRKETVRSAVTSIYHVLEKTVLFEGLIRVYQPRDEEGDHLPKEERLVQASAPDLLLAASEHWTSLIDLVATQDVTNTQAKADLVIDDKVILREVPVTFLMFLEKHLLDMRTFLGKLPTLDPARSWNYDSGSSLFRTEPTTQYRVIKAQEVFVKVGATKEHPAQTELVPVTKTVGIWTITNLSGAIEADEKKDLLLRIGKLLDAVKCAREKANSIKAINTKYAANVLEYLFKGLQE